MDNEIRQTGCQTAATSSEFVMREHKKDEPKEVLYKIMSFTCVGWSDFLMMILTQSTTILNYEEAEDENDDGYQLAQLITILKKIKNEWTCLGKPGKSGLNCSKRM